MSMTLRPQGATSETGTETGKRPFQHIVRGLCIAAGLTIGSCLLAVADSFVDGLTDSLLGDET